jgi:hypothetical protein
MTENKNCDGCIDDKHAIACNKKRLMDPCPCQDCLVKVMCNKECEEFIKFAKSHGKELLNMRLQRKRTL